MEEKKSIGLGFGLLLGTISIFIMMLIGVSFFAAKPEYCITPAMIVLFCLLLILALSGSFDNFSIGKLLTVSKQAKINRERAERLEKEKDELIHKIMNINFQTQKTSNNVVIGGNTIGDGLVVQKANSDEIKAEEKEEEKVEDNSSEKSSHTAENTSKYRYLNRKKYRLLLLKEYFGVSKIDSIEEDVKLESQYQNQNIDPISVQPMLFHAHLNDFNQEFFVRIVEPKFSPVIFSYRMYGLLNRVYQYRNAKNSDVCLVLLLTKLQGEDNRMQDNLNRLRNFFAPAITSGLLKIKEIELSEENLKNCYETE